MTPEERLEKGIEAIIFLQGMATIPETREQATAGWNGMSINQQDFTLAVYSEVIKTTGTTKLAPTVLKK